jgi:Flp pilus assembly protein TadG
MQFASSVRGPRTRRRGKILALVVVLMPILLGMMGLIVDGGLMMATHRQAQNAADAAALAAAWDLLRGQSSSAATTATTFVHTNNGLSNATVTVNIPPSSASAYSGNSQFAEVIVSVPVTTLFIQALSGVSGSRTVKARATAGYEAVSAGEGVAVLDPTAAPGLSVTGGGSLVVHGRVTDNSQAGGVDENGNPVNNGENGVAASANNNSTLKATWIGVVGGVDNPANYQNVTSGAASPLHCKETPEPDPLIQLPTPTTSNGVSNQYWSYDNKKDPPWKNNNQSPQEISFSTGDGSPGNYVQVPPGIYSSITISNGAYVNFAPSGSNYIYVLSPQSNTTTTLKITGGTVTGNGIMFYNTGGSTNQDSSQQYNATTGAPDTGDAAAYNPNGSSLNAPPTSIQNRFGGISISSSATVTLTPNNTAGNVFKGMLFYQRRANTSTAGIAGNNGSLSLTGTLYAKWASFQVSGGGTYQAQFVVGSIAVSGQADLTINYSGGNLGKANQVYLVE